MQSREDEFKDLKAVVEELTKQISSPQSFQVLVQRDNSDLKQLRTKMAHLASRLRVDRMR